MHHNTRHGHKAGYRASKTYKAWEAMRYRCGRREHWLDVTYDLRWDLFDNFLEDMGEAPIGASLYRIDRTKPYSKDNCRWATAEEQQRNRTQAIFINGEHLIDIAARLGIKYQTAWWRLRHGTLVVDGESIPATPATMTKASRKRSNPT